MTETAEATSASADLATAKAPVKKKAGGLNSMLLPELKQLAGSLGIKGITGMRKSALIEAISATQSGARPAEAQRPARQTTTQQQQPAVQQPSTQDAQAAPARADAPESRRADEASAPQQVGAAVDTRQPPRDADAGGAAQSQPTTTETSGRVSGQRSRRDSRRDGSSRDGSSRDGSRDDANRDGSDREQSTRDDTGRESSARDSADRQDSNRQSADRDGSNRDSATNRDGSRDGSGRDGSNRESTSRDGSAREGYRDDERGGSRNSRRRNRNRDRSRNDRNDRGGRERTDVEPQVSEDDVLVPVAGILDLLDNYAFVRTSGYLPGPNDVYVALSMVRRYGLRKGDAITGAVRQNSEGGGSSDRREKFNPIARIDSVNGADPETAKSRVEFAKLTPLYASERLRLETEQHIYTTRLIDIVAPIGKGQRGLIVAPSKAGKTMVMQAIANAVTTNNPECHLMVVLVDERPEEVTEMQRAVKGEVISSTFDRPADDHTTVAELAIERAKRLVELGHDVFVLLDSITKLGRAYNLSAPASGRIMSGGVDSSALYPPKRFFGAARNIEDGGSLTILATALIETGSKMDEVIFEEFKGTGNMELRLRREFANKRIFPAIDVDASGTRREELLMSKDELAIVWKLRRVLSALDGQQALELLLEKLRQTKSNVEFLMQVNKTTPTAAGLRGQDDD